MRVFNILGTISCNNLNNSDICGTSACIWCAKLWKPDRAMHFTIASSYPGPVGRWCDGAMTMTRWHDDDDAMARYRWRDDDSAILYPVIAISPSCHRHCAIASHRSIARSRHRHRAIDLQVDGAMTMTRGRDNGDDDMMGRWQWRDRASRNRDIVTAPSHYIVIEPSHYRHCVIAPSLHRVIVIAPSLSRHPTRKYIMVILCTWTCI